MDRRGVRSDRAGSGGLNVGVGLDTIVVGRLDSRGGPVNGGSFDDNVRSQEILAILADMEAVAASAPDERADFKKAASAQLSKLDKRLARLLGQSADERPAKFERELQVMYRGTTGFSSSLLEAATPLPTPPARSIRRHYDLLGDEIATSLFERSHPLDVWRNRSWLGRRFSRPPAAVDDHLYTKLRSLRVWSEHMLKLERDDASEQLTLERAESKKRLAEQSEVLEAELASRLSVLRSKLAEQLAAAGPTVLGWTDPGWEVPVSLRLGVREPLRIGSYRPDPAFTDPDPDAPATVVFPFDRACVIDGASTQRSVAVDFVRSLCLRLLAAVPPGGLEFTFVDPVAIGQSIADFQHLADFNPHLVDSRPLTNPGEIDARLSGLSGHLETVISKYLRGQFSTIDEYNEHAGELAEAYRVLVVFDYPAGFTETSAQQLLSLMENGPRCGLHTVVVADPEREQPRDLPFSRFVATTTHLTPVRRDGRLVLDAQSGALLRDVLPDTCPSIDFDHEGEARSAAARLLVRVGEGSRRPGQDTVTLDSLLSVLNRLVRGGRDRAYLSVAPQRHLLDKADEATWWKGSTAAQAIGLLGKSGAQDLAALYFSSTEIAGGAIMVGLPRSGKTTALHATILSACMLYGPDELELYLIDAKHGVEFKIYEDLPHARMVSINSEREFSVAILKSLDKEISRRANLMKRRTSGRSNITEYRSETGEQLARIVLVVDEFHELFEEDDQLGHEAFQAFSNIVRQGPFAGVHVIVASQTLSNMPAMDRPTLQLLPERVAFMCNESDADVVMGDLNRGTRLLTRQGDGLFNPARGEPSQNKPFRGLFVNPDERTELLARMRALAARTGWVREPRVFDGSAPARRPPRSVEDRRGDGVLSVAVGEPFSLDAQHVLRLRRSRGSNIALIGGGGDVDSDETMADVAMAGAVHSLLGMAQDGADIRVVDFTGNESAASASPLTVASRLGARYARGRDLDASVEEAMHIVQRRYESQEYSGDPVVLLLLGMQRALDLRPFDYGDDTDSTAGRLRHLLTAGSEVGVHVVVTCDSIRNLQRRISAESMEEFSLRVCDSSSSPTDLQFVTGGYSTPQPVQTNQLLIGDQQRGTETRVRAYEPIDVIDLPGKRGQR